MRQRLAILMITPEARTASTTTVLQSPTGLPGGSERIRACAGYFRLQRR